LDLKNTRPSWNNLILSIFLVCCLKSTTLRLSVVSSYSFPSLTTLIGWNSKFTCIWLTPLIYWSIQTLDISQALGWVTWWITWWIMYHEYHFYLAFSIGVYGCLSFRWLYKASTAVVLINRSNTVYCTQTPPTNSSTAGSNFEWWLLAVGCIFNV
jgi:hypothetical protein